MSALVIDRRAAVEALLRARGVQVVRLDEQKNGVAVSPNGLTLRVLTPEGTTPEEAEVLRGRLVLGVAALRAGGIPVIFGRDGLTARLGVAPVA